MLEKITNRILKGSFQKIMLKKDKKIRFFPNRTPLDTAMAVLDSLPEHIGVIDITGEILAVNRSWSRSRARNRGGAAERPAPGTNYLAMLRKHSSENRTSLRLWKSIVSVLEGRKERFTMEYASQYDDGRKWYLLSVTPMKIGEEVTGAVISHSDITRRKLAELESKRYSVTDPMTGILNRKAGLDYVHRQMKYCDRHGCTFTVCYIDLDNLKLVNDSFGHKEGDKIITSLVNLLKRALRESDAMSRLGGDEILLILQETTLEGCNMVLKRIMELVDSRNARSPKPYRIEFSYGLAEYTLGSKMTAEELVDRADKNMYIMKSSKKAGKDGNYGSA